MAHFQTCPTHCRQSNMKQVNSLFYLIWSHGGQPATLVMIRRNNLRVCRKATSPNSFLQLRPVLYCMKTELDSNVECIMLIWWHLQTFPWAARTSMSCWRSWSDSFTSRSRESQLEYVYEYIHIVIVCMTYSILFCFLAFSLSLDIGTLRSHSPSLVSVLPVSLYDISTWCKPTNQLSLHRKDCQNTLHRNW